MTAIPAMLASCILLGCTTLYAKMLGSDAEGLGLHPFQITAGRFAFAWIAIAAFSTIYRPDFNGTRWSLHIARSLLGWLSGTCLFAAATQMQLASATALSFLSPLVSMCCAILFLAERIGRWRWTAAVISLLGALVLTRPGSDTFQPAALIAIAAALFMGIEAIFIKRLSDTEPPVRILLVNNSIGLAIALVAVSFVWQWPGPDGWVLLAAMGLTMIGAQALLIHAMQRGDASQLVPLFYTILIFSGLLDLAVFGEVPDIPAVAGATLIVVGAIIISLRGQQNKTAQKVPTKS